MPTGLHEHLNALRTALPRLSELLRLLNVQTASEIHSESRA